jgi:hypothetical protein
MADEPPGTLRIEIVTAVHRTSPVLSVVEIEVRTWTAIKRTKEARP